MYDVPCAEWDVTLVLWVLEHLLPLDHHVPVADQQAMPAVHAMHCAATGAVATLQLDVSVDVVEQPG